MCSLQFKKKLPNRKSRWDLVLFLPVCYLKINIFLSFKSPIFWNSDFNAQLRQLLTKWRGKLCFFETLLFRSLQEFLFGGFGLQTFHRQSDYRDNGPDEGNDPKDDQHREPIFECANLVVAVVDVGVIKVECRQIDRSQRDWFVLASRAGEVVLSPDETVRYSVSESLTIVGPFGAVVLDQ